MKANKKAKQGEKKSKSENTRKKLIRKEKNAGKAHKAKKARNNAREVELMRLFDVKHTILTQL